MKFFDSHAHLNDEKFDEDREELIEKIHNDEIEKFITAGYSIESSKKAIELCKKYKFMYPICGISPNDIPQTGDQLWKDLAEIEQIIKINNRDVSQSGQNVPSGTFPNGHFVQKETSPMDIERKKNDEEKIREKTKIW